MSVPRHPAARLFAAAVLRDGTKPAARNLAAAYLALSAELREIKSTNARLAAVARATDAAAS